MGKSGISRKKWDCIIAIKSTVTPGTTNKLRQKYSIQHPLRGKNICFVPEFLRERCATTDFVENQKLLAVGTHSDWVFDVIKTCHGDYPHNVLKMGPTEAELLKYYHNTFNALRVVFANEFYKICEAMKADYNAVKHGLLKTSSVPDIYLDVNKNMRGYSSICWNKDIPAIIRLARNLQLDLPLIENIPVSNDTQIKTPFKGTRE